MVFPILPEMERICESVGNLMMAIGVVFRKTMQRYDEEITFCKFFRKKMQKKIHHPQKVAKVAKLRNLVGQ